jgi:methionyl-tRNA synthetase
MNVENFISILLFGSITSKSHISISEHATSNVATRCPKQGTIKKTVTSLEYSRECFSFFAPRYWENVSCPNATIDRNFSFNFKAIETRLR